MNLRGEILVLDEVGSTQEVAADSVRGGNDSVGVVFAHDQTAGRGRFGREWVSKRGESLTMSIIFWDYADWPAPWLVGMSAAIAAANAVHCSLRWPNDLAFEQKKTGGILTELFPDQLERRVPVVGMGINLVQESFPQALPNATSVYLATGEKRESLTLAALVLEEIRRLPEPLKWESVRSEWMKLDRTPGKAYRMADGKEAIALGIAEEGQLLCFLDGKERRILAADAIFG